MSQLLDEILSSENMKLAYKKVKANKGGQAEWTGYQLTKSANISKDTG